MAIWEYKVITSGKGGFATPALLEKFLNDLGKEEWDILHFQTQPDNPLAFTGVARRSTLRDWTLEDAAAAAARKEADKLRAEFEAKFKGAGNAAPAGGDEDKPATAAGEAAAADDGFRRVRNTESDLDPDAPDEEPKDEWDMLTSDDLPTFFDAIRPHLRRNQRGPGMSVGVDYLAKKWDLADGDIRGALVECGFTIPGDEDELPAYIEYEGDLYWLNLNRRGELWLNMKEKPRPVFRIVQGQRVAADAPAENEGQKPKAGSPGPETDPAGRESLPASRPPAEGPGPKPVIPGEPLPAGPALLEKIRPLMRRNRRGPGGSGSTSFLSRALKCAEADLMAAFATLGLTLPATPGDKPVLVEVGPEVWWLNQDSRGGVWINGREKAADDGREVGNGEQGTGDGMQKTENAMEAPAAAPSATPEPASVLSAVRLLLKETKTGAVAGLLDRVAGELGKSPGDLLAALTSAGLVVPEKARAKPVFAEHAGEIFWLNKNAKDELWLNAKASKYADGNGEGKSGRRGRSGRKTEAGPVESMPS
jgi:hypothetical protein